MKNKRLLYVLLPAVLAIWGLIFQRIWSAAVGEPEPGPASAVSLRVATGSIAPHEAPKLLLNYGDPFKGGRLTPVPHPVVEAPSGFGGAVSRPSAAPLHFPAAAPPVAIAPVVWPGLRYLGSINNAQQNSQIALLAVNDQEVMLKVGESQQGVVVAKIFRDSVRVSFQGKKKTVIR